MSNESEIMVTSNPGALMPVMDIAQAKAAYTAMVDFVKSIMRENTDFGVVPGTKKPTLLKPGAEKLCRFFGLSARFDLTKEMEEWFADEPFFSYRYKCSLYSLATGALVGEGEGSCNSHEKKYRYRNAARACPECGKEAIFKSKKEYGGGWYCNTKAGGCGAKFPDSHFSGDAPQQINPDMADLPNTLQKMAQKRAFIAATLIAVNASEFFTQDVEDLHYGAVDGEYTVTDDAPKATQAAHKPLSATETAQGGQPQADSASAPHRPFEANVVKGKIASTIKKYSLAAEKPASKKQIEYVASLLSKAFQASATKEQDRHLVQKWLTGVESATQFNGAQAKALIDWLADETGDLGEDGYQEAWRCLNVALEENGQMRMEIPDNFEEADTDHNRDDTSIGDDPNS